MADTSEQKATNELEAVAPEFASLLRRLAHGSVGFWSPEKSARSAIKLKVKL